jgi:hypothetical protein
MPMHDPLDDCQTESGSLKLIRRVKPLEDAE